MTALLAGLCLVLAAPASAQTVSVGPSPELWAPSRESQEVAESEPVAQALDRVFGPAVWAQVRISTYGPVVELSRLTRAGFYKLEIIELVVMSAEANRPLQKTVERRGKGVELAAIAKDYGLVYDRVHEEALAVEEMVDREYLPRFPERIPRRKRSASWRDEPD